MSREELGHRILHGFEPYIDGVVQYSDFPQAPSINKIRRRGNVCVLSFSASRDSGTTNYIPTSAKIIVPEEYRPKVNTYIPTYFYLSYDGVYRWNKKYLVLTPSGEMNIGEKYFPSAEGNLCQFDVSEVGYEI